MPHDPQLDDASSFQNHGVIEGRFETDYLAGDLDYEVVLETGDHRPYLPTEEPQSVPGVSGTERYNCVTQGVHSTKEIILEEDIALGRMPKQHERWLRDNGYFDDNGNINFSERFNSVQNGTVWNDPGGNNGNYVSRVCQNDREVGLIPAKMLPDIPSMQNSEYYNNSCITPEMVSMGKEFLKRFQQPYGWVGTDRDEIKKHLKQAPLAVTRPGHEIVGIDDKAGTIYLTILDSYKPFVKDLPYSRITDVMKLLIKYVPFKETQTMVGYKKVGDPTTYVGLGNNLIPVADWPAFVALGGSTESTVELSEEQWAKFTKINTVLFKTK